MPNTVLSPTTNSLPLAATQVPADLSLQVTPSNNYVVVAAGQPAATPFTLTNHSDFDLLVTPSLRSFSLAPDQTQGQIQLSPTLPFDSSTFSLTATTTPTTSSTALAQPDRPLILDTPFLLPASAAVDLELTITPPLGQTEQEYYLTTLFTAQPATTQTAPTSGSHLSATIGSNLILLVSDSQASR